MWGNRIFPLFKILCRLFIWFFRIALFVFLELLLLFDYHIYLLSNLSYFHSVNPIFPTFFLDKIISQPYPIVAHSDFHLVTFHSMVLDSKIKHLFLDRGFETKKLVFFGFDFFLEVFDFLAVGFFLQGWLLILLGSIRIG